MLLNKTKFYIVLSILIIIIIFLIYNAFQSRAEIEEALKGKQTEKEEVIRVRDSARMERERRISDFEWDFDSLSKLNKKIIYVPYEKLKYVDRSLYDAINILDSTNYEQ